MIIRSTCSELRKHSTPSISAPYLENSARPQQPGNKIHVCSFNELRRIDAELCHQILSLADSHRYRFILFENDFQFEPVTEVFDPVQMHASPADHEQRALLTHSSRDAVGARQGLAQRLRRRRRRNAIRRLLPPRLVGPLIKNPFALLCGENTHLQTSRSATKEPVVLNEFDRTAIREPRHFDAQRISAFYARFDFDIAAHLAALCVIGSGATPPPR